VISFLKAYNLSFVNYTRKKQMANIDLNELNPTGSELFQDSESYLNEINEKEVDGVIGGTGSFFPPFFPRSVDVDIQSIVGNTVNANSKGNNNTVKV
jgi:hypothetical protein